MSTRLQRSRSCLACASAALFVFLPALRASEKNPVVVHEWGTFTSLQDEKGNAIGGINVDDEPVPDFVCQYSNPIVVNQHSSPDENFGLPPYGGARVKGWVMGDPDITMRLETPVIYIYPPKGRAPQSVPSLDVHVDFHGGLLSQFYPYAKTNGADLNGEIPYFAHARISSETITGLTWSGVKVGVSGKPFAARNNQEKDAPWIRGGVMETTDKVWTTPRETGAPLLGVDFNLLDGANPGKTCKYSEAEHFLFYRGVGHLDGPLFLAADPYNVGEKNHLSVLPRVSGKPTKESLAALDASYAGGWLAEIRPDGSCAFEAVPPFRERGLSRIHPFTKIRSQFEASDFSGNNLARLKASMQDALVQAGLYPDEASAMLRTWELSYFKSPGMRFFYLTPREWTDAVLPLKITGAPVKITRVMVGRLELVSSTQRAALQRLAAGPCPDLQPVKEAAAKALEAGTYTQAEKDAFYSGDRPLRDLGIAIPPLVQDYLDLGRFRDALILHEQQTSPSPALAEFISKNRIAPPATVSAASPAAGVATAAH